jgi:uncharacterized protein YhfF/N-acetylglutamate synthase-like GNAT family acetyltransferase
MTVPRNPNDGLPRWGFARPGPLRDRLTVLALAGTKTTTAGLLVESTLDGQPVPAAGDRSVLVDSVDRPVALVETDACRVLRLADVDDQHAVDEGEGYANAAEFRLAHERYWNTDLADLRKRLGDPTFSIGDETEIVAERFRLIEVLGAQRGGRRPIVRPAYPPDRASVNGFLAARHADVVARRGELVDTRQHPALMAEIDGRLAGVLSWILDNDALEVLTLYVAHLGQGTGTTLLAAVRRVAEAAGARRLWLVTTNDNLDSLRFFQRRGLRLAQLRPGAVDQSRATLKPAIPVTGEHGIAVRDELELELEITPVQG